MWRRGRATVTSVDAATGEEEQFTCYEGENLRLGLLRRGLKVNDLGAQRYDNKPKGSGDCGGNGYCNNGGCLCYAEYGGADCTVHAESKHIPIKCALDCVHSCLGKCNHVYSHDGFGPSRACYVDCTRTCLPGCAGGAAVGAAVDAGSSSEDDASSALKTRRSEKRCAPSATSLGRTLIVSRSTSLIGARARRGLSGAARRCARAQMRALARARRRRVGGRGGSAHAYSKSILKKAPFGVSTHTQPKRAHTAPRSPAPCQWETSVANRCARACSGAPRI